MRNFFRKMMQGRYGMDKLNMALLYTGFVFCIVSFFFGKLPIVNALLTLFSYLCLALVLVRSFSKKTYKRYQENRKFCMFFQRLKDRRHRYYDCPRCRQQVRVPRGKGKISISCPKCKEKFIKRT